MGDNVGKDVVVVSHPKVRQAEQEEVENNAEAVEGYQGDEDLSEHWFQVHVPPVQNGDCKQISCIIIFINYCIKHYKIVIIDVLAKNSHTN